MKSVLISIRPQWCEKIASGKKTIEVRKTAPKEVPFKCYIYMTATKERCRFWEYITAYQNSKGDIVDGSQKVIGEFICDRIVGYYPYGLRGFELSNEVLKNMCLSNKDLNEYGKLDRVYGWHISDLKIYDKPKELSEFYIRKFDNNDYCSGCIHHEAPITEYPCNDCRRDAFERKYLTRPPQSWQYVGEVGQTI